MMKRKIALLLALALGLSACSAAPSQPDEPPASASKNESFTEYLNDYVVKVAENDYTTLHHYFEHPEKYGIDMKDVTITLGSIEPDEKTLALEGELDKQLDTFDRSSLDSRQQRIYDQLQYEFEQSDKEEEEKFRYLGNMWSTMNGLPQSLISFFSEYELREEADIAPLITLIQDVPRYTKDALDYSRKQAERDTLMLDYDETIQTCQNTLDTQADSAVRAELMVEVEQLGLDKDATDKYKQQINMALDEAFFPSYQTMIDGLNALKPDIQPLAGLSSLENGKEYYELLVQEATGTDDSVPEIKKNIEEELSGIGAQMSLLIDEDMNNLIDFMSLHTDFSSVDDILIYLNSHYSKQFPQLEAMEYDLQPLADDQSQEGIVAYFMLPAVDSTSKYRIRYNRRDYGDDPTAISLYQTLAHEGIPGHMYQAQYNKQNFVYTIEYFLSNPGFSEGYATYVENQALKFLDLDPDLVDMYVYNDLMSNYYVLLMDIAVHYENMDLDTFKSEFDMFDAAALEDIYAQLADNPGVFMSYYYGFYKINQLRQDAKEQLKDRFDEVDFNNALLSAGSVNFDLIKQNIDQYIQEQK
ncbi:DUF885 family protein [uncultured Dubosiella sp.]|uniref:DUF885 family protein n=1 Tax=uncultured Dubosiella sp. TaxID=1937011 RepID=UPI00272FA2A7|nr:DUF885 family protein [uncultured Dubosiella sp.]